MYCKHYTVILKKQFWPEFTQKECFFMTQKLSGEDESYKYMIKNIKAPMLEKLGYQADAVEFKNVELIPKAKDKKYMDILCTVDGKFNLNIEPQSTPVYDTKMEDMYKYRTYTQCEDSLPFKTCVLATYPPNHGIRSLEIDEQVNFHPDFFFTQKIDASKIIKTIKNKNKNNKPLSKSEAIDILLLPDAKHDCEKKEMAKIATALLIDANLPDEKFRKTLFDCQEKILQRFYTNKEIKELKKMHNIKAEDYKIEPGTTGFEEAVNLSYLSGKREGYSKGVEETVDAINLIKQDVDDETISKSTGLDIKTIQKLKKEIKK